jgi:hypothetical protein
MKVNLLLQGVGNRIGVAVFGLYLSLESKTQKSKL